jgi:hypothetical protein
MLNAETILKLASEGDSAQIAVLAEAEIRDKAAKAKGGNSLVKRIHAATKYLNDEAKKGCKVWSGCTWMEDGKQCFVNGYTAFALNEPLEGLRTTDAEHFNVLPCFPDTSNYITAVVNVADVTARLKIYKAKHGSKTPFDYDIGNSRYNAQYILDCYNILGGDIVFKLPANGEITPAVMESENGNALLCPVRKVSEKERVAC